MIISRRLTIINNVLLVLVALVILFEMVRDALRDGDFVGYVNAGNAVMNGTDIYDDFLNTWPPFFSIFSIPLSLGDAVNSYSIRFIWLIMSVVALNYIIQISLDLILHKRWNLFNKKSNGVILQENLVVLPLLISLRYIMDNLSNVQINIFMLLCSLIVIQCFVKKQYVMLGFILGLTISIKVYTIFLLFYFIYKREWQPVAWTLLFVVLINACSLIIFGYEQGLHYYLQWGQEIAPRSFIPHHKNQSVFGAMLRLFTDEYPSINHQYNLLSLESATVKKLTYIVVAIAAIYPAYLFRNKIVDRLSPRAILEYSFILTAIPILSPLSWKAYFIFLWVPYLILYLYLYRAGHKIDVSHLKYARIGYWVSIICTVFSTEAFVGGYFSDILETYSVITLGVAILMVLILWVYRRIDNFNIKQIAYLTKS